MQLKFLKNPLVQINSKWSEKKCLSQYTLYIKKKKKKQSIKLEPNGLSRDPKNCPLGIRKASYRIWPDVDIAHELRHLIGSYTCISIVYQPIRVLHSLKYLHFSLCLRLHFLVFGHQKLHLS